MRRLARWVFNGAAAVLAVLSVGVCVLWVRSYRVATSRDLRHAGTLWEVVSERGRLRLDNAPQRDLERARHAREWAVLARECVSLDRQAAPLRVALGQASGDERAADSAQVTAISARARSNSAARAAWLRRSVSTTALIEHSVPHALVAAAAAVPMVARVSLALFGSVRRKIRAANALCLCCGYDLRATSDRCPECGTKGSAPAAQKA